MSDHLTITLTREEARALSLASIFGGPHQPHAALDTARNKLRQALARYPCTTCNRDLSDQPLSDGLERALEGLENTSHKVAAALQEPSRSRPHPLAHELAKRIVTLRDQLAVTPERRR